MAHPGALAAALHRNAFAIDASFELVGHGVEEVQGVIADVEADQVVGQHAVEQLLLPREDPEHFLVGPRDVPEERGLEIGAALLEITSD